MSAPDAWGLKYQEVVGLCKLAYKEFGAVKGNTYLFTNTGTSWSIEDVFEHGVFRAILVRGHKKILAFSGTDDGLDWGDNIGQGLLGISPQYLRASRLAGRHDPDVVVGHSLGGGLASYSSIYRGKHAATINPAALNINPVSGVGMLINNGKVVNYVVKNEALDVMDNAMINMRRIGRIYHVPSTGSGLVGKHLIDNLVGYVPPQRT